MSEQERLQSGKGQRYCWLAGQKFMVVARVDEIIDRSSFKGIALYPDGHVRESDQMFANLGIEVSAEELARFKEKARRNICRPIDEF